MSDTTHSDSHGPAHYFKIWRILIVLMLLSLGGPIIFSHTLTGNLKIALVLIVAFGVAIVKAYLVAKHFMHLPLEPKYIGYMLAGMIAFMLVLWAGIAPDLQKHQGLHWDNVAAKEEISRQLEANKNAVPPGAH